MAAAFLFRYPNLRAKARGGWTLVLMGCAALLPGHAQETPTGGDVVMMSPYEVSAHTVEFKGWTKLRSPNFIVYTDASLKQVRPLIRQMEMLHLVAQVTFGRRPLAKSPAIVVLPTSSSDWKKVRSKGEVEWRVAVSSLGWVQPGSVVEYDWQADGASVLWASLTRTELLWLGIELPLALNNGFAYYFETIRQTKGGLQVGRGNSRIAWLNGAKWFGWDELFTITGSSPVYTQDGSGISRFNAQSALFVHYLMTRDEPERLDQLLRWAALLRAGREPAEERFTEVFGLNWTEIRARLDRFTSGEKFNTKLYQFPPESLDFVVTEIDVKAQEMRDLFVLIQICNQRVPASEASLDVLLAKGLQTPELRQLLLEACREWKRSEGAWTQLNLMLQEDRATPEVYDLAMHLAFEEGGGSYGVDARLPEEAVETARGWGRQALAREPLQDCINQTLCWVEALAPTVNAQSLDAIKDRLAALDGNGDTDVGLAAFAVAAWRAGEPARARRACEALLNSDYSGERSRAIAREVMLKLDAAEAAAR